jgi:hypothetical protein
MMNNQDCQKQTQKRPYRKPEVIQVPLRPEEAVLGHCKSNANAGPGGSSNCHPFGNCFSLGS